jgi:nucleoside-diphosphate-sugar epimerase
MMNEFRTRHPEELGPNGQIKVCIGGGAGFIGSHIAKQLREEVSFCCLDRPVSSFGVRDAMLSALIGKRMSS